MAGSPASPHSGSTSHREPDDLYATPPPWDIGRPQPAFLAIADAGAIRGRVLDVGCGTGEHALMSAALGLDATGVDLAATALHAAERKAGDRGLTARFLRWDARELAGLGKSFDTVLDCGLFHVFGDADLAAYVDGLRSVLPPGGRFFLLCFSDQQPGGSWPHVHRVTRGEIEAAFADGWQIDSIEPSTIEITTGPDGIPAWLATLTRRAGSSRARVPTPRGERYAKQLCSHAARMSCRTEWNPPEGVIEFPDGMGICRLAVQPGHLVLTLEAPDPANLARLQQIVSGDIERFANREDLKVEWAQD